MRETRLSGSEGGGTELNRSFLPLSRLERVSGCWWTCGSVPPERWRPHKSFSEKCLSSPSPATLSTAKIWEVLSSSCY